eukprot:PhF_6_TR38282/c0_g2_i1/m.57122
MLPSPSPTGYCCIHNKQRSFQHLRDLFGQPGFFQCTPGHECKMGGGQQQQQMMQVVPVVPYFAVSLIQTPNPQTVQQQQPLDVATCQRHNKQRSKALLDEVISPDGLKHYECKATHPCKAKLATKRMGDEIHDRHTEIQVNPPTRRAVDSTPGNSSNAIAHTSTPVVSSAPQMFEI